MGAAMKRILDTTIYRDIPMRIDMLFPGVFCALSLLLCGLYPLAIGALPAPRATQVQHVEPDVPDTRAEPSAIPPSEAEEIALACSILN
jgi:hypothetical protein